MKLNIKFGKEKDSIYDKLNTMRIQPFELTIQPWDKISAYLNTNEVHDLTDPQLQWEAVAIC